MTLLVLVTIGAGLGIVVSREGGGPRGLRRRHPPASIDTPFLWGAATSSYQVEGGINCSDPSLPCNDYDFFNRNQTISDTVAFNTARSGPSVDLAPAGRAVRFWNPGVYRRDFDNAQVLGLNAFRISLEWARIEPRNDVFDQSAIDHYKTMLTEMRKRGLEPILTLNHFTLPMWALRPPSNQRCLVLLCFPTDEDSAYQRSLRGWANGETLTEWAEFVRRVVPEFRHLVDYWLTINEPMGSQVVLGYVAGIWSPGFVSDGAKAKKAIHNLIEAHVRAYDIIKTCAGEDPACDQIDAGDDGTAAANVGFAHAMGPTVAAPSGALGSLFGGNRQAASNFAYFLNDYFLNAVVYGQEDTHYLESATSERGRDLRFHPEWRDHLDFLGINFYRRFSVFRDLALTLGGVGFVGGRIQNNLWGEPVNHEMLNDLGWTVYPKGLYEMIMRATRRWGLPVLVTENGIPERTDANRAPYIVAHVAGIERAIGDGAVVLGYLHWTMMDNWELHEQYRPEARFGLFGVARNVNLRREITEGALAYQHIVAESQALSPRGAPTQEAVEAVEAKFGTIARDGSHVLPPSQSHGRFWETQRNEDPEVLLYLGITSATQRISGMIFRHDTGRWHRVALTIRGQRPYLRETWYDNERGHTVHREFRAAYRGGSWEITSQRGGTIVLPPVGAAGLWRWKGESPWGTRYFYVNKLGDRYSAKFLTFSAPIAGQDEPKAVCGPGGCVPDAAGHVWRAMTAVARGSGLRLYATGWQGENLFDVSLRLAAPRRLVTSSRESGQFTVSQERRLFPAPFGLTGYVSPAGDSVWSGTRDAFPSSEFRFLQKRAIAVERAKAPAPIGGVENQYHKQTDPRSVLPLRDFTLKYTDGSRMEADITWELAGRRYTITAARRRETDFCTTTPCIGHWTDIADRVALRVPDRFPALPIGAPKLLVQANNPARTRLDWSGSIDRYSTPPESSDGTAPLTPLRDGGLRCVYLGGRSRTAPQGKPLIPLGSSKLRVWSRRSRLGFPPPGCTREPVNT